MEARPRPPSIPIATLMAAPGARLASGCVLRPYEENGDDMTKFHEHLDKKLYNSTDGSRSPVSTCSRQTIDTLEDIESSPRSSVNPMSPLGMRSSRSTLGGVAFPLVSGGSSADKSLAVIHSPDHTPRIGSEATSPKSAGSPPKTTIRKLDPRMQHRSLLAFKASEDAQRNLQQVVRQISGVLGAGHPIVESAKVNMSKLRKRDDEVRWQSVVDWHRQSLTGALRDVAANGDVSVLEAAVKNASDSELGHGHSVVLHAKRQLLLLKKQRAVGELRGTEAYHHVQLQDAADEGDLETFHGSICVAARALGASHPVVESARKLYKQQRADFQRQAWQASEQLHAIEMSKVCATNNPELIQERLQAAQHALGKAHPVAQDGRRYLLELKKETHRAKMAEDRERCLNMLQEALQRSESALAIMAEQQLELDA